MGWPVDRKVSLPSLVSKVPIKGNSRFDCEISHQSPFPTSDEPSHLDRNGLLCLDSTGFSQMPNQGSLSAPTNCSTRWNEASGVPLISTAPPTLDIWTRYPYERFPYHPDQSPTFPERSNGFLSSDAKPNPMFSMRMRFTTSRKRLRRTGPAQESHLYLSEDRELLSSQADYNCPTASCLSKLSIPSPNSCDDSLQSLVADSDSPFDPDVDLDADSASDEVYGKVLHSEGCGPDTKGAFEKDSSYLFSNSKSLLQDGGPSPASDQLRSKTRGSVLPTDETNPYFSDDEFLSSTPSPSSRQPAKSKGKTRRARPTRPRNKWTKEETDGLLIGVSKLGIGNWKKILACSEYKFYNRTAVDLKDRFRTCCPTIYGRQSKDSTTRQAFLVSEMDERDCQPDRRASGLAEGPENRRRRTNTDRKTKAELEELGITSFFLHTRRRERRQFSHREDRAILEGFGKHGAQWNLIKNDVELGLVERSRTDLRDRFRNKYPDLFHRSRSVNFTLVMASKMVNDFLASSATAPQLDDDEGENGTVVDVGPEMSIEERLRSVPSGNPFLRVQLDLPLSERESEESVRTAASSSSVSIQSLLNSANSEGYPFSGASVPVLLVHPQRPGPSERSISKMSVSSLICPPEPAGYAPTTVPQPDRAVMSADFRPNTSPGCAAPARSSKDTSYLEPSRLGKRRRNSDMSWPRETGPTCPLPNGSIDSARQSNRPITPGVPSSLPPRAILSPTSSTRSSLSISSTGSPGRRSWFGPSSLSSLSSYHDQTAAVQAIYGSTSHHPGRADTADPPQSMVVPQIRRANTTNHPISVWSSFSIPAEVVHLPPAPIVFRSSVKRDRVPEHSETGRPRPTCPPRGLSVGELMNPAE